MRCMRSGGCGLFCEFQKAAVKCVNGGCAGAWAAFHGSCRRREVINLVVKYRTSLPRAPF